MVLESTVQAYIKKHLRKIPNSEWEKATVTNKRGSLDIKGQVAGFEIQIEVKRDSKELPSKLQRYQIHQLLKKGSYAFWTWSWEDCKSKLNIFFKQKGLPLL